ncbi:MAG: hypothetical protein JO358_03510 [Alphaproteobacteria bacterium]|nr:hypothetical protein [Alphaproteobacteria bacterium]
MKNSIVARPMVLAPRTIGGAMLLATKKRLGTCLIVLVGLSTACTTMRPIPVDAVGSQIRSQVHVGDTVRVLTEDRRSETIEVAELGDTALVGTAAGARVEVPYQSIQRLEVRRVSGAKTTGLIIGVVVAIALGAAVSAAEHPHVGL